MTSNQRLTDFATPAFIVNRHAFRRNCELARTSAYENGIYRLRPHVKTHKTKEGCLIQAGIGTNAPSGGAPASAVVGFVASIIPELAMLTEMACDYLHIPFRDLLLGVPICKSKLSAIQELKNKLSSATNNEGNIHVLVDNPGQVDFLEEFISSSRSAITKWSVFLKIDTGYHRAGVTCDGQGVSVATKIITSSFLCLKGLYSHCGHSYNIDNAAEMKNTVLADHNVILQFLKLLTNDLNSRGRTFDTNLLDISVGSTPSMFCHEKLNISNKVELHPGNYVFYDRQQLYTGACDKESSIAGFILTRVIGHYKDSERNAIMVDAGATALTKETTPQGDMCAVFGHPELECYRMTQEVTMIRCRNSGDTPFPFEKYPLGSTMLLVPNHSCLAAACFDIYHIIDEVGSTINTNSEVVDIWKPVRGWA